MKRSSSVVALLVACAASPAAAFDGAFKELGFTWDVSSGPIRVSLEPNGSDDIDDGSDLEAVRASFNTWACAEGTSVRFEETDEPGLSTFNAEDGVNSVFWDEDGSECLMGPGTLGIGGGDGKQGDVCFNGKDSTWGVGTATDVQSIAMHEIGHFIGFAHPCDVDEDLTTCLPVDTAIMFPQWSGNNERDLLQSEKEGVKTLYPADPDLPSGCNGPFGPGEKCACNDECIEGLICIPDADQVLRCGKACAANSADCGQGGACVLDVPQDGGVAPGVCVAITSTKPAGAVCAQPAECESGTCIADIDIGTSVCVVACDKDGDCAGGTCFKGKCLGGFEAEECPVLEPEPTCGCATAPETTPSKSTAAGFFAAAVVVFGLRRRREHA